MATNPAPTVEPVQFRRIVFMPWHWHRGGWSALAIAALVWLIFYVVSFPVVDSWMGYSVPEPPILKSAIVTFYSPLDFLIENSDAAFAFYVWELRVVNDSPTLSWLVPAPAPVSDIYPCIPNLNGSTVVE